MDKRIIINCLTGEQTSEEFAFIPHVLTKSQKLETLNAEYNPQRNELDKQLFRAIFVWQDTEIETEIRAEIAAMETEYYTKAEAIRNE